MYFSYLKWILTVINTQPYYAKSQKLENLPTSQKLENLPTSQKLENLAISQK